MTFTPATKPLSVSPSGASAGQITEFSKNVSADVREMAAMVVAMGNRSNALFDRILKENDQQAQLIDGLQRQIRSLNTLVATRAELTELAAAAQVQNVPSERTPHMFFFAGMSPFELLTRDISIEPNNSWWAQPFGSQGGITLPVRERRSLLFGNDPLTGETQFPENLTVNFTPLTEGQPLSIEESKPILALNDDNKTPFYRVVRLSHNDPREVITGQLDILIPSNFANNLEANLMEIEPYPNYTTAIYGINLYDENGTLLETFVGPWSDRVTIPLDSVGRTAVSRVQLLLATNKPRNNSGFKEFRYGVSKFGLYQTRYANQGKFYAYHNAIDQRLITGFTNMRYNVTGGERDLISTGRLRLRIEVPTANTNSFPFNSDEYNASWVTVYDTNSYLDQYSVPGQGWNYFPTSGISSSSPIATFRINGDLKLNTDNIRPLLSDVEVTFQQASS